MHSKLEEMKNNKKTVRDMIHDIHVLNPWVFFNNGSTNPLWAVGIFSKQRLGEPKKIGQLANVEELMLAMASLHDCPHLSL